METVWYQVIDGFILPLDVVDETPKTLVLKDGSRIMKDREVARCFDSMEDARVQVIRNLEDGIKHHEDRMTYHKEKFVELSAILAELRQ